MLSCQERQGAEMARRHEEERDRAQQQVDAENRKEEQRKLAALEQERDRLLKEKKNRQATEIASRPDMSDEELKAVSGHRLRSARTHDDDRIKRADELRTDVTCFS